MRISAAGLCLVWGVWGCGAVDVAPEVTAFSTSVSSATAPMAADLAARTADEEAVARARAVAAGAEVYGPPLDCTLAVTLTPGTKLADCRLEPLATAAVAPGSAKAMLAYTKMLVAYAEALSLLAKSDAPDTVGKAFGGLRNASGQLANLVPDFAPTANTLGKANPPLSKLGGRLIEAQRLRLIRQLVRDAGPGVSEALDRLIAYRDADDGLTDAAEALNEGYDAMEAARRSGDAVAYGAAVTTYEAAHADLRARLAGSDAGRLILIREAQTALVERLSKPGDLKGYVDLIETLNVLSDAIEQ